MLHYEDTGGDKPVVLMVHGILMDLRIWRRQIAALRETHRVIAVDLAGFGKSAGTGKERLSDHITAIQKVLVALNVHDVTFVGWSMGGAIGLQMAATQAKRLGRLVLFGATPQLVADARFQDALPAERIGAIGKAFVEDFRQGSTAFGEICAPNDYKAAAFLTKVMTEGSHSFGIAALSNGQGQSQIDHLSQISIDSHVIHGTQDEVCLPKAAEYLAANIPGCTGQIKWINGAGHAAHLTHTTQFNAALESCLK